MYSCQRNYRPRELCVFRRVGERWRSTPSLRRSWGSLCESRKESVPYRGVILDDLEHVLKGFCCGFISSVPVVTTGGSPADAIAYGGAGAGSMFTAFEAMSLSPVSGQRLQQSPQQQYHPVSCCILPAYFVRDVVFGVITSVGYEIIPLLWQIYVMFIFCFLIILLMRFQVHLDEHLFGGNARGIPHSCGLSIFPISNTFPNCSN